VKTCVWYSCGAALLTVQSSYGAAAESSYKGLAGKI
jgi:hypothetical protein